MSAGGTEVVGTPAFTAPETLQRLALDGRTDLYSLGVTLYYTLTGRLPYSARTFSELNAAWSDKPLPPSTLVEEIPAALDDLALISVEPALRPHDANPLDASESCTASTLRLASGACLQPLAHVLPQTQYFGGAICRAKTCWSLAATRASASRPRAHSPRTAHT